MPEPVLFVPSKIGLHYENMIASLSGTVIAKGSDRVVINVSGVGYEVLVAADCLARMPAMEDDVFLFIHTNVREDAITLYGFLEEKEKELFLILKTVSGIGPKLALAILAGLQVEDLCRAIQEGDVKRLTTLQGVGKKTAERICVELKDKVGHLLAGAIGAGGADDSRETIVVTSSVTRDTISALTNLGYPDAVARQAVASVQKQLSEEEFEALTVEALIRDSLRSLA